MFVCNKGFLTVGGVSYCLYVTGQGACQRKVQYLAWKVAVPLDFAGWAWCGCTLDQAGLSAGLQVWKEELGSWVPACAWLGLLLWLLHHGLSLSPPPPPRPREAGTLGGSVNNLCLVITIVNLLLKFQPY